MSSHANKVKIGGGRAAAAEAYQRREGKYVKNGLQPILDAEGQPTGEKRSDLVDAAVSVPKGSPDEWADPVKFWEAAEQFEKDRARSYYQANQSQSEDWREKNPAVPLQGLVAAVPPEIAGDEKALKRWVKEQTTAFFQSDVGQVLKDSPLEVRLRVQFDDDDQPVALGYEAQSRAEWMETESDIAFKNHVNIDNRFTEQEAKELAERIRKYFNNQGLYCSTAIHFKNGNHHIHFTHNLREIKDGAFTDRRIFRTPKQLSAFLKKNREFFASSQNEMLREKGLDPDVEYRSFEEQGIDRPAEEHEGYHDRPGARTKTGAAARNLEKRQALFDSALADPSILTSDIKQATFTRADLEKRLAGLGEADAEAVPGIVAAALAHEDVVKLDQPGIDGQAIYATRQNLEREDRLLRNAATLAARPGPQVSAGKLDEVLARPEYTFLSEQQRDAARHVCGDTGLALVRGVAGAGKTTLNKAAVDALQESGYQVVAMAPTGAAADIMGAELGITGKTIQSYIHAWKRMDELADKIRDARTDKYRAILQDELAEMQARDIKQGDVILVDEAGLAGTDISDKLFDRAGAVGAHIRLCGDPNQYAAVDAGAPFEYLIDEYGAVDVTEVVRQRHDILDCLMARDGCDLADAAKMAAEMTEEEQVAVKAGWTDSATQGKAWMQTASELYAAGEGALAMRMYLDAGRVVWTETDAEAVEVGASKLAEQARRYGRENVIGTVGTNADAKIFNEAAREELADSENPAPSVTIQTQDRDGTANGETVFHVGDRVSFLRNDNYGSAVPDVGRTQSGRGVRNGTRGIVSGLTEQGGLIVRLDKTAADPDGREVVVNPADYAAVSLGLAVTGHRSQGATASASVAVMSKYTDARSAYVQKSRHRDELYVVASHESFATEDDLIAAVDRRNRKGMAAEQRVSEAERPYFQMVSELVQADKAARSRFKGIKEDCAKDGSKPYQHPEFAAYEQAKAAIKPLAETVSDNKEHCARFLRMAEMSAGRVDIMAGRKERTYSAGTDALRTKVKEYAETVTKVRDQWNDIQATHPGPRCYHHPDYQAFDQARQDRDRLAAEIAQNPNFKRWTAEAGIGAATVERHAAAHAERQAEADRVGALDEGEAELHAAVEQYQAAYADLRATRETVHQWGGAISGAETEAATVDRLAQVVRDLAADQPDADAALRAEGLDPDHIRDAAERADAADAMARYQYFRQTGDAAQAAASAEKIMIHTRAERPRTIERMTYGLDTDDNKKPRRNDGRSARISELDTDQKFDFAGATSEGPSAERGLRDLPSGELEDAERRDPDVLLPDGALHQLDEQPAGTTADLRRPDDVVGGEPRVARPWTAAVVRSGGDWQQLQQDADTHAADHAPPALRRGVKALRTYFDARTAALDLAPLRAEQGERAKPSSPAYLTAQAQADAAAWKITKTPMGRAAVEWWDQRRRKPTDQAAIEKAAVRHQARLDVDNWQKSRDTGMPLVAASLGSRLLAAAEAERQATGPKPVMQAIRAAGVDWSELRVADDQHSINTAPAEQRPALAAASDYLDARKVANRAQGEAARAQGIDFRAAWPAAQAEHDAADAAAARLIAQPGAEQALHDWQARLDASRPAQAKNGGASPAGNSRDEEGAGDQPHTEKPGLDIDKVKQAAARHAARQIVEGYQIAPDDSSRAAIAQTILAASDAEREAGGRKPTAAAVRAAGIEWRDLRAAARTVQPPAQAAPPVDTPTAPPALLPAEQTPIVNLSAALAARPTLYRSDAAATLDQAMQIANDFSLPPTLRLCAASMLHEKIGEADARVRAAQELLDLRESMSARAPRAAADLEDACENLTSKLQIFYPDTWKTVERTIRATPLAALPPGGKPEQPVAEAITRFGQAAKDLAEAQETITKIDKLRDDPQALAAWECRDVVARIIESADPIAAMERIRLDGLRMYSAITEQERKDTEALIPGTIEAWKTFESNKNLAKASAIIDNAFREREEALSMSLQMTMKR